jgi:hypothetical protein
MSTETGSKPFATSGPNAASTEFRKYCEAEFERRVNSGDEFDQGAYREALEMVLKRLSQLEQEGQG